MLAKILHEIYAYQIFQSVFFRASMGFLTSYFLTSILMPPFIAYMYKKEYLTYQTVLPLLPKFLLWEVL